MATQKAKIVGMNGNGVHAAVSDPANFPIPLEGVITVELTTGRVVQMVIGELEMLYERGEIPNELTRIAARELMTPPPTSEAEREKRYMERLRLVRWVAGRVLVAPQMDVAHLYHDEIWQIYDMANSPALALDNFRRQQARHVGVVPGQQDVEPTTEPAAAGTPLAE